MIQVNFDTPTYLNCWNVEILKKTLSSSPPTKQKMMQIHEEWHPQQVQNVGMFKTPWGLKSEFCVFLLPQPLNNLQTKNGDDSSRYALSAVKKLDFEFSVSNLGIFEPPQPGVFILPFSASPSFQISCHNYNKQTK